MEVINAMMNERGVLTIAANLWRTLAGLVGAVERAAVGAVFGCVAYLVVAFLYNGLPEFLSHQRVVDAFVLVVVFQLIYLGVYLIAGAVARIRARERAAAVALAVYDDDSVAEGDAHEVVDPRDWFRSSVTLATAAQIKLRLGPVEDTALMRKAAWQEGSDYLRRQTAENQPWHGLRTQHAQLCLAHAVALAFVPNADEVELARLDRSWTWAKRRAERHREPVRNFLAGLFA